MAALALAACLAVLVLWLGGDDPHEPAEGSAARLDRSGAPRAPSRPPPAAAVPPEPVVSALPAPSGSERGVARDGAQAPAPEAREVPLPELLDRDGEPTPALVHAALSAAVERHLPDRKLSSDELDAASDALWRLRQARLELLALGDDPARAERRRELVEAIGEATSDFSYHLEMTPSELTALDESGSTLAAPPPTVERVAP